MFFCSRPSGLFNQNPGSQLLPPPAPASMPSASVNQQRPLNCFLAGSISAPKGGDSSAMPEPTPSAATLTTPMGGFPLPQPHGFTHQPYASGKPSASGQVRAEQLLLLQSLLQSTSVSPALPEALPSCQGISPTRTWPQREQHVGTGACSGCSTEVGYQQQPMQQQGSSRAAAVQWEMLLPGCPGLPWQFLVRCLSHGGRNVAIALMCCSGIWCCTP